MDTSVANAVTVLINALLVVLITVGAVLIRQGGVVVITWLKAKLGETNYNVIKGLASTIVRFLQQSPAFEALEPEKKKEMAITYLTQKCAELHLPFTHDDIDKIAEEAVQIMKSETAGLAL
jgi:hypothetical protein